MAFTVEVLLTLTGLEYTVPLDDVGVLPSVVYRMAAPEVVVLMVTVRVEVELPPVGVNVGVTTTG